MGPRHALWICAAAAAGCAPPQPLTLSCDLHPDNALRAVCDVTSAGQGAVTLTWGSGDEPEAHELQLPPGGDDGVPLLWLQPERTHSVTARTASATQQITLTAGRPPFTLGYGVEGESSIDRMVHKSSCRASRDIVISSTQGATIWYHTVDLLGDDADVAGVRLTPDDTLLTVLSAPGNRSAVAEYDLSGNLLFHAIQGEHFAEPLHHDATKVGEHIWALFEYHHTVGDTTYLLDGFYVFDRAGDVVFEWRMSDQLEPPAPVEPTPRWDFSHANSISVDSDLGALVSFRNLSSLVYVDSDWSHATAGVPIWWLGGQSAPVPNDFSLFSAGHHEPEFIQQHHAVMPRPDELTMFDNAMETKPSRLLSFELRQNRREAHLRHTITLDRHCFVQGAFYRSSEGNAFATCAEVPLAYEYVEEQPDPVWQMRVLCEDQDTRNVDRFIPFEGN